MYKLYQLQMYEGIGIFIFKDFEEMTDVQR